MTSVTAAQLGETTYGGPQNLNFADSSNNATGQLYDATVSNGSSIRPVFANNQILVLQIGSSSRGRTAEDLYRAGSVPGYSATQADGLITAATRQTSHNYSARIDIKNPYSEQWNIGVEYQLMDATVMSLNYVGSQSHRTDIGGYYNTGQPGPGTSFAARRAAGTAGQPFPYTVPNRWDRSWGNGNYNGLQVSVLRQFRSGYGYTVAYT